MLRLITTIFLATAVSAAAAKDLALYRNTNELVWDKAFTTSVKSFFGKSKGSYFWRNGLLSDQVIAGLGGPPQEILQLQGTSLFLASACRHHSCTEKASAVLSAYDSPVAFGVVHYACFAQPPNGSCSDRPHLQIFSRDAVSRPVREAIISWAEGQVGELQSVNVSVLK